MADDRAVNTTEGQNNEGGIAVKEKAETASNKRADMEKRRSDMEQAERAGRSEGDSYTAEREPAYSKELTVKVRVCRMCIQPGHIVRDCPDFLCRKCGKQGHYARECEQFEPECKECGNVDCVCKEGDEEESVLLLSDEESGSSTEDSEEEGEMEEWTNGEGTGKSNAMAGCGSGGSSLVIAEAGESAGMEMSYSRDSEMAALKDLDLVCVESTVEDGVKVKGGGSPPQGTVPPGAARLNTGSCPTIESGVQKAIIADNMTGNRAEAHAAFPNTRDATGWVDEMDSMESVGVSLEAPGGRKRALLEQSGRRAGGMTKRERKKGKVKS
ncbi:hypothetical protein DPEC_G00133920 [Dallia pectoralis]|uniref:Uncharacterized protein n=1 Tax=Dallia pectoralis TaxID=75939 RepID=A0ACC2GSA2_DALPE|nr:hypothetical protein DPEC_G00133920 [Dallia pectoralis]